MGMTNKSVGASGAVKASAPTLSQRCTHFLVDYRLPFAILCCVIVAVSALGLPQIRFGMFTSFGYDEDSRALLNDQLEKEFPAREVLLFVVSRKQGSLINALDMDFVRSITKRLEEVPHKLKLTALTNYTETKAYDDILEIKNLIPEEGLMSEALQQSIELKLLDNDRLLNFLISKDLTTTQVILEFESFYDIEGDERYSNEAEVMQLVNELVAAASVERTDLKIFLLGNMVSRKASYEIFQAEISTLLPLLVVVMWGIFYYFLRSLAGIILGGLLLVSLVQVIVLGLFSALGIEVDNISFAGPSIVALVMAADSVHLMTSFFIALRQGNSRQDAMVRALAYNLRPILLTTITTMAGFLSLNYSETPSIVNLGNMVAFGTLMAFVLTVGLLPFLLIKIPTKVAYSPLAISEQMARFGRFSVRYSQQLFYGSCVIIMVCFAGFPLLQVDWSPDKMFSPGHYVQDRMDHLKGKLSYEGAGSYVVETELNGVNEPEFLREVDQLSEWLRRQNEVLNVYSYVDFLKELNRTMHNDNPKKYQVPSSRELAAQYLLLYEITEGEIGYNSLGVNDDKSMVRIAVQLNAISNKEGFVLEERANQWLAQQAFNSKVSAVGGNFLWPHLFVQAFDDMIIGAVIALAAITIMLIIAFRSLRLGLLTAIPNVFPATMLLGFTGYFSNTLALTDALILSVTIGIVVDDTVHFVSKYADRRREGFSMEEAIVQTFTTTGSALVITSVSFSAGLVVMLFSDLYDMVILTSLMAPIIILALALDFMFLPALLIKLDKHLGLDKHEINGEDPQRLEAVA